VALRRLGPSDDLTFASSVAYYALLPIFPLLLLFSRCSAASPLTQRTMRHWSTCCCGNFLDASSSSPPS